MTNYEMKIVRRTFEAAKHPKGSAERTRLNLEAATSEYMPSYRYMIAGSGTNWTFRSKAEAEAELTLRLTRAEAQA